MGLGDFTKNDQEYLNNNFSSLRSNILDMGSKIQNTGKQSIDARFSDIKSLLEGSNKLIMSQLAQLKAPGGPILDAKGLENIYNSYKAELAKQQNALAKALDAFKNALEENERKYAESLEMFKKAAEEYEQEKRKLLDREIELGKREAVANAEFVDGHKKEMHPYQTLQKALEAKQAYLNQYHEDFAATFKKREDDLTGQLKELSRKLQDDFAEKQRKLLEERSGIEQKRSELNDRETELNQREEEVQNGLSGERQQLQNAYQSQMDKALDLQRSAEERFTELAEKEKDLYEREQKIREWESIAENGFTEKLREREDAFLQKFQNAEKRDNERHEKAFEDLNQTLRDHSEKEQQTIREKIKKEWNDFETEIAEKKAKLLDKEKDLNLRYSAFKAKENDLIKREEEVYKMEARLKELIILEEERKRVIGEEIQDIARDQIAILMGEKNRLDNELVDLRLAYNKQVDINNKFGDKRPEDVFAQMHNLEEEVAQLKGENHSLSFKIKNLEAGKQHHR